MQKETPPFTDRSDEWVMDWEKISHIYQVTSLIRAIHKGLENNLKAIAQKCGMTYPQMMVVSWLYFHEGSTVSEIAENGLWHLATTIDILNRMEKMRWIEKQTDARDARVTRIRLMPLGKNIAEEFAIQMHKDESILNDYHEFLQKSALFGDISELYTHAERFQGSGFTQSIGKMVQEFDRAANQTKIHAPVKKFKAAEA